MKKLILAACAALLSFSAVAATLNPIQLLNPAGSTSGQTIISTGSTTAPAWNNVSLSALTGVLPILNGGTGQTTAAAALTALGGLSTTTAASTYLTQASAASTYLTQANATSTYATKASPQFTGSPSISGSAGSFRGFNYFTGTSSTRWFVFTDATAESGSNAGSNFGINAYSDAGSYLSTPITIVRSTGAVAFSVRPTFAGNTPYDTGNLTIANYLTTAAAASTYAAQLSPTITTPNIVGVTNGSSAAAGSVGEYPSATNLTGVSLTNGAVANASSISLTAGDYDLSCTGIFSPAGSTVPSAALVGISTVSAGMPSPASGQQTALQLPFSTGGQIVLPSPVARLNVTVTTLAYCVVQLNFITSTATVAGVMRVRRVH